MMAAFMRKAAIIRLIVLFLGLFSLTMIFPLALALAEGDRGMARAFALSMGGGLAAVPVLLFTKKPRSGFNFNACEGILLVAAAWIAGCLLGALPYYLSGYMPRFSDALFESVSGFTTTGASVIPDVEILPRSFHLWRGMSHWLGGMGIVVLTVALVPMLGVGGFALLKAETTGPMKDKFTPRVTGTAKILWLIYCGFTVILALLFWAGGMNFFEALIHAFSTMGTGGFSTRNGSIASFASPFIDWVCAVFMVIAGFNFTLIYRLLQGKFREVLVNSEARAYALILPVSAGIAAISLMLRNTSPGKALRLAFFDAASILTTTGFLIDDHNLWPPLAQGAVFILMFIGACSGSTSGGIKIIRYVILAKQMKNELLRTMYPSGLFSVQLDRKPGRKDVVYSAAGFICIYFALLFAGTALAASAGIDLYTAVNASLITLGNIGLGFGRLVSGAVFYEAPGYVRWGFSLLMILGRLELYTVLLLFTPSFWKQIRGSV
ncbi:MAG: TrkH family potassium uptake protein [Spirochaetaceae bacterium]|jgi:trk system potassium uptake protein TrkH|nr:TrkH family potassium uptake protein [Spirochaetaceae bacterium]